MVISNNIGQSHIQTENGGNRISDENVFRKTLMNILTKPRTKHNEGRREETL